jgi:hypothetical protein
MAPTKEPQPAKVVATPKPAGEAAPPRDPWWWVERGVWTERMLTRLTAGGRGKGIGATHQRWPNAWFARRGLLSLAAEHAWTRTIVRLRTH